MERIDGILHHPVYVENQKMIDELEVNRIFCCHSIEHSLDVARILYIKILEQNLNIAKDVAYAAGLLHDLGRGREYSLHMEHHEASADLAKEILWDCGYEATEIELIVQAISNHKQLNRQENLGKSDLKVLLYEADKQSRKCFDCKAQEECYWSMEKRNRTIVY